MSAWANVAYQPGLVVTPTAAAKTTRVVSVDLLRGVVMIIMALDHSRDFLTNSPYEPTDLAHTTPVLFFTRWITHFCAPVFMFLAGTGTFLSLSRGRSRRDAAWFLISRGLFLVIADETIMRIAWFTKPSLFPILGSTLWGIGWAMVGLSALIWLPRWALIAVSGALVMFSDAFDGFTGASWGAWQWAWVELHTGSFNVHGQPVLFVGYSLVPWVAVMSFGYVFGQLMLLDAERRRKYLFILGILLTSVFIGLRWTNWYGDPGPWTVQGRAGYTLMSFLNCEKYPPSLLFLLMTLGPAITALPLLGDLRGRVAHRILVLGRVPLFYYVLHIFVLHAVAIVVCALLHKPIPWTPSWAVRDPSLLHGFPPNYGFGLPVVYGIWAITVIGLYPVCVWYADLKKRRRDWWLSYV